MLSIINIMELSNMSTLYYSIIAFIIVYLAKYVYQFYSKLKYYPKGPKPLPLIGNIITLTKRLNRHPSYILKEMVKDYGDIFTIWLGSKPVIIISGIEMAKHAFNLNECSDRIDPHIYELMCKTFANNRKIEFSTMNMGDEYKAFRKVSIESLRKLINSNVMPEITHKIVDETVDIMKATERGKHFVPFKYIEAMLIRSVLKLSFQNGTDFEYKTAIDLMVKYFHAIQCNIIKLIVTSYLPIMKIFIDSLNHSHDAECFENLISKLYVKSNEPDIGSDKCQCLAVTHKIAANNMMPDDSDKVDISTESIIIGSIMTLLLAGNDTSHYILKWMLLFMCKYQEMQKRMRVEIIENIGPRIPNMTDKKNCHFVNAFICETFRFRAVAPLGLFHTSSQDINLENALIPKGTMVFVNLLSLMNDVRYWDNPEIFNPERFLDSDQHFVKHNSPAFKPFGIGKRMCIGKRFAMDLLFLVLTRFLQTTNGLKFELEDKYHTDFEPKPFGYLLEPKLYKISLAKEKI